MNDRWMYLLNEAQRRGAKTVLLTAKNKGIFEEFCDEIVLLPSLKHLNYGNVISPQFPALVMLDIIYSYYVEQDSYSGIMEQNKGQYKEAGI